MTKTLILGGGRSSLGAGLLLQKIGKNFVISDISEKYPEHIQSIRRAGFPLVIGPQTEALLEDVDEIIISPGLPADIPLLIEAKARGLIVKSEIDFALEHFDGQIIGVTGTNGKSTTTTLITHILQNSGINAVSSGNIGIPPSLILADTLKIGTFVLELSSYQLDFSLPIKNHCSVFTSFSEDHLERHKDMRRYFLAKWKLILATEKDGLCIMPRVVVETARQFGAPHPKATIVQVLVDREKPVKFNTNQLIIHFDSKNSILSGDGIKGTRLLPPEQSFHNKLNIIYSILATQTLRKQAWETCLRSMASYSWLPYRFQEIGKKNGFSIFNDSKSTNIESTLVALQSVEHPCILLLGGLPKGESFQKIALFKERISTLIAFGAAAPKVADDLPSLKVHQYSSLKDAIKVLPNLFNQRPGPIIFSPGCSSFDEFSNFEERGEFFNKNLSHWINNENL